MKKNNKQDKHTGLAKKLIIFTIIFSSTLTLVITAIQLYQDYKYDLDIIESRFKLIDEVHLPPIVNNLWLADKKELLLQMNSILKIPDVQYLELMEGDKIWIIVGKKTTKNIKTKIYNLHYTYDKKSLDIGSIKVDVSLDNVYQKIYDKIGVVLISNGIKTSLVAVFIFLLFSKLITRHLATISGYTLDANILETTEELKLNRKNSNNDELDAVVKSINSMRKRIFKQVSELGNQKEYLSIMLNSIGDAVIATDAEGYVTHINPVAERLTGWSFDKAKNQPLKMVFPIINASSREPIENPIDKVISTGETVYLSNHTTLISKDGTEYQIADSAAPIRNEDGNILGMVLVFNDVTEQYQMRQELYDRSILLKKVTDRVPGMVFQFLLSSDGGMSFPYMSDAVNEIYHFSAEEVLEDVNRVFSLTHPDDVEMLNNSILKSAHNFSPWKLEYRIRDKDGRVRWLYGDSTPERIPNGDILWHGFVTDITDKKEKEEQLRRSQKMDALGKLTGGVAHDYNNMLGVILGYSEIIEDMAHEQPELANYIHEIKHAGERGAKLTKKLLTFSRQQSSENIKVNLNTLLQDSQLMLEKTMTVRISLVFDLEKDLWPINIAESDLEDAILNININAMHAIKGNGQVIFETRNEIINEIDAQQLHMDAGEYVLLSITDTGCGMDSETKEKIFDPFYSTKGELGTGLGLSQVYGLVQRANGYIKIYSEPGHGSRFTLYFPRDYESDIDERQFEEGRIANLSGNQTILVVDDEPALAKLTSHILTLQGYNVFSAGSGKEALLILEKEPIDLLLSDVIMPEMDGYQLAAVVFEKYPNIKIQLASGFSDDRHVDNINLSLHQNLLHKPYHSKELLLKIRELFNGSPD